MSAALHPHKKRSIKGKIMPKRNGRFFDAWSVVHLVVGVVFGWTMAPFVAVAIMVLWEPLEILVLSPFLARFGIKFGYESLRNSLSDIFFDVIGVSVGAFVLSIFISAPFHFF